MCQTAGTRMYPRGASALTAAAGRPGSGRRRWQRDASSSVGAPACHGVVGDGEVACIAHRARATGEARRRPARCSRAPMCRSPGEGVSSSLWAARTLGQLVHRRRAMRAGAVACPWDHNMGNDAALRTIDRRTLKTAAAGAGDVEIAWRFGRTPKNLRQVIAPTRLARQDVRPPSPDGLGSIERRVMRWRIRAPIAPSSQPASAAARPLRQGERLARDKLAR